MGNSGMRCPTVRAISGLQEGDFVSITVVKRSGQREPYDANKINLAIEAATVGLDDNITWVTQIASELELTLFDGITRHSPEGINFKTRAEQVGWKQAVRERDAGTFDWTANRPINPGG